MIREDNGTSNTIVKEAMPETPVGSLPTNFETLTDPRIDRRKEHKLIDIVTIAICAVICGADGWVNMETFGKAKEE